MMGPKQEAQVALFYEFSVEDHVPQDHLLRSIDRLVDLDSTRSYLTDFYSHTGRPSVDPELLIRMLLVGYCFGSQTLQPYRRKFSKPRVANGGKDGFIKYRASKLDCDACPLKPRCCPTQPTRNLLSSVHEAARDVARNIRKTDAYMTSFIERRKVEMLFAHLKRYIGLRMMRLRGPKGATEQFQLAATAQNLRKLAKLVPATAQT